MGQDQHAAGARRLDEAERGDRLAGAGRVLEPEALGGVGVLGLLGELLLVLGDLESSSSSQSASGVSASARSSSASSSAATSSSSSSSSSSSRRARGEVLVVVVVLVERASSSSSSSSSSGSVSSAVAARSSSASSSLLVAEDRGAREHVDRAVAGRAVRAQRLGEQRRQRPRQRVDLVRGERRAVGELRLLLREHALEPEQQRVLAPPGGRGEVRPASISTSAASSARRRGVPAASATGGSSPGCTKGSRVNVSARAISASPGRAIVATDVGSAIEALASGRRSRWQRRGDSAALHAVRPAARPPCYIREDTKHGTRIRHPAPFLAKAGS